MSEPALGQALHAKLERPLQDHGVRGRKASDAPRDLEAVDDLRGRIEVGAAGVGNGSGP